MYYSDRGSARDCASSVPRVDAHRVTARDLRQPARNGAGPVNVVLALILTSQLMVVLDATIVNIALHDIRSASASPPPASPGSSTPTP